jgi:uncharacterized protein (DUF1778 family)
MATRTERIDLRVTPEEKSALSSAAAAVGMTLTGYLLFKVGELAGEALGDAIVKKAKQKSPKS